MYNFADLLKRAVTIRDEKKERANTANRVGSLFIDIINWTQENCQKEESKDCNASMCKITEEIKVGKDVGYAQKSHIFTSGTSIQDILIKILRDQSKPLYDPPTINVNSENSCELGTNIKSFKITGSLNYGNAFKTDGTWTILDPNGTIIDSGTFNFSSGNIVTITPKTYSYNAIGEWTINVSIGYTGNEEKGIADGNASNSTKLNVFMYYYYKKISEQIKSFSNLKENDLSTYSKESNLNGNVSINKDSDGAIKTFVIAYPREYNLKFSSVIENGTSGSEEGWNNSYDDANVYETVSDLKPNYGSKSTYNVFSRSVSSSLGFGNVSINWSLSKTR